MSDIHKLTEKIIAEILKSHELKVEGKTKKVIGFCAYSSLNMGEDIYYKINFFDNSSLLIIPSNQVIYKSNSQLSLKEIMSDTTNPEEYIRVNNKMFLLDNQNDFQYVVRLYLGTPLTIDGEVRFSDYVNDEDNELITYGVNLRSGKEFCVKYENIRAEDIEASK